MLLIPCPICGPRPELEFSYGGEANLVRPRDPSSVSDQDWAAFLYARSNPKGTHRERWRHVHGCGRFFSVARNTVSEKFEP
jgi:sarcosine oxidase subunit delta